MGGGGEGRRITAVREMNESLAVAGKSWTNQESEAGVLVFIKLGKWGYTKTVVVKRMVQNLV